MDSHDLVVIGSGPGGYRTAVLGALRGLSVAVVERGVWGGGCLNRGCVPKKAWQHQSRVTATVRENYAACLKRLGVATLDGHARLAPGRRVEAAGRSLAAVVFDAP